MDSRRRAQTSPTAAAAARTIFASAAALRGEGSAVGRRGQSCFDYCVYQQLAATKFRIWKGSTTAPAKVNPSQDKSAAKLRIGRGDDGQDARFTALFPGAAADAVPGMSNRRSTDIPLF